MLKLKGLAYVEDKWKEARTKFMQEMKCKKEKALAEEIVQDIVDQVKSPPPPPPDVTQPSIAESIFESKNSNQRLFYNQQVHTWFTELYNEIQGCLGV